MLELQDDEMAGEEALASVSGKDAVDVVAPGHSTVKRIIQGFAGESANKTV